MGAIQSGTRLWMLTASHAVFPAGDAGYHDHGPALDNWDPVGLVPSVSGNGYRVVDGNGKVAAFGEAKWEVRPPDSGKI